MYSLGKWESVWVPTVHCFTVTTFSHGWNCPSFFFPLPALESQASAVAEEARCESSRLLETVALCNFYLVWRNVGIYRAVLSSALLCFNTEDRSSTSLGYLKLTESALLPSAHTCAPESQWNTGWIWVAVFDAESQTEFITRETRGAGPPPLPRLWLTSEAHTHGSKR